MVVVPVKQALDQDPPNPQNPTDTNPPLHIPIPLPLPNLQAHLQNLPEHIPNIPTHVPNPEQPQDPPVYVPNQ